MPAKIAPYKPAPKRKTLLPAPIGQIGKKDFYQIMRNSKYLNYLDGIEEKTKLRLDVTIEKIIERDYEGGDKVALQNVEIKCKKRLKRKTTYKVSRNIINKIVALNPNLDDPHKKYYFQKELYNFAVRYPHLAFCMRLYIYPDQRARGKIVPSIHAPYSKPLRDAIWDIIGGEAIYACYINILEKLLYIITGRKVKINYRQKTKGIYVNEYDGDDLSSDAYSYSDDYYTGSDDGFDYSDDDSPATSDCFDYSDDDRGPRKSRPTTRRIHSAAHTTRPSGDSRGSRDRSDKELERKYLLKYGSDGEFDDNADTGANRPKRTAHRSDRTAHAARPPGRGIRARRDQELERRYLLKSDSDAEFARDTYDDAGDLSDAFGCKTSKPKRIAHKSDGVTNPGPARIKEVLDDGETVQKYADPSGALIIYSATALGAGPITHAKDVFLGRVPPVNSTGKDAQPGVPGADVADPPGYTGPGVMSHHINTQFDRVTPGRAIPGVPSYAAGASEHMDFPETPYPDNGRKALQQFYRGRHKSGYTPGGPDDAEFKDKNQNISNHSYKSSKV